MSRVTSARKNGRVLPLALSSLFALAMAALPALGQYTLGPAQLNAARLEKIRQRQVRPTRSTSAVKRLMKPTQSTSAKRPLKPRRTLSATKAALRYSHEVSIDPQPMVAHSRTPFYYRSATTRTLHSTIMEYVGITDWDVLWQFPTTGPDPLTEGKRLNIPQNFETTPPEGFDIVDVMYGNIGQPAEINIITFGGNVRLINPTTGALTDATAPIIFMYFDGVDVNNPPDTGDLFTSATPTNFGNIARLTTNTPMTPRLAFFNSSSFTNTTVPGVYSFDLGGANLHFKINDPQGRYGVMIAKIEGAAFNPPRTDNGPFAQWVWWANSAVGSNTVWTLDTLADPIGLFSLAADDTFNQSARGNSKDNIYGDDGGGPDPDTPTHGTINYFLQLRGTTLARTPLQTGMLAGNVRRRGVDIPAPATPESAPGNFDVFTFDTGTDTLRRVDSVWTQPSYDALGVLTQFNYTIEGLPVGNFDFVFVNRPIFSATDDNSEHNFAIWPFSDFDIAFATEIEIADFFGVPEGQYSDVSGRFELWADMVSDPDVGGARNNLVDQYDLAALIENFDKDESDPTFNPAVDVAGDFDVNDGAPDGIISNNDLAAIIERFDKGGYENP